MPSDSKFGAFRNKLLINSTAGDDVTLIPQSVNLSSLRVTWMLLSRDSVTSASCTLPCSPTTNRDFKIRHYGRLGRLDAYTGGLGP